nr:putative baseplate assembly protein [uncultured Duganella sp.]
MKRLAPNLFDRRFGELMEIGRARLPGLAPDWTDHNAHDPGITLMELLAWVTEAQLYAIGRMRRDERAAYAALFGLAARGSAPARGLIWPDRLDPRAPAAAYPHSVIVAADTVVTMVDAEQPMFRPGTKLLLVPGRVLRLEARLASGKVLDYTAVNARGGAAFQPFGPSAGSSDVLRLAFECRSDDGLFPTRRADADGALWPLGVRADQPLTAIDVADAAACSAPAASTACATATSSGAGLAVTLVTPSARTSLTVVSDSSEGMLRTGVLLLDLSAVQGSPASFTLELRATRGFERPPRLLRIEPNVVPIVQDRLVADEVHIATGDPHWGFQLDLPGLRFAPGHAPVSIALRAADSDHRSAWRPAPLADSGPLDPVYEFDAASGRVTFGNGVNGRIPPAQAAMLATYAVSDGEQGGVSANHRWTVRGFAGAFGVNPDAVDGGAAASGWIDERREARRRARVDHALVSAEDIVSAAKALPLLEVERAWLASPAPLAPRTGTVTLVAMRARTSELDAGDTPETPRWLEAVRRRLVTRMPLATRLVVTAPRYIDFSLDATIEVASGRDPATVRHEVERVLARRLALTGDSPRQPGVPVSTRDLVAWLRVVHGVRRIVALRLVPRAGGDAERIGGGRNTLPRLDLAGSELELRRAAAGEAP